MTVQRFEVLVTATAEVTKAAEPGTTEPSTTEKE